ncbi:MAG: TetR/AcrR family transcriptional regulator [Defluviitaleaceae bacterium]|nr:TetR/AcrR family transcriptional regulator [Defluviitaleaceae bacterium]
MIGEENQKFMSLDEDKRERIINAAITEFLAGYKKASTDNIVREAGISKGLLFHYFGTKEKLYDFLVDYAVATVQTEYLDLINTHQPDILDSIWQLSLLKQDLSKRFPTMFEFLTRVYIDDKDCPAKEHLMRFNSIQAKVMQDVYAHCDKSLFRDDIAPEKIIEIITWAVAGYSQSKVNQANADPGSISSVIKNYDDFLDEFKVYLSILRKVFFK